MQRALCKIKGRFFFPSIKTSGCCNLVRNMLFIEKDACKCQSSTKEIFSKGGCKVITIHCRIIKSRVDSRDQEELKQIIITSLSALLHKCQTQLMPSYSFRSARSSKQRMMFSWTSI